MSNEIEITYWPDLLHTPQEVRDKLGPFDLSSDCYGAVCRCGQDEDRYLPLDFKMASSVHMVESGDFVYVLALSSDLPARAFDL